MRVHAHVVADVRIQRARPLITRVLRPNLRHIKGFPNRQPKHHRLLVRCVLRIHFRQQRVQLSNHCRIQRRVRKLIRDIPTLRDIPTFKHIQLRPHRLPAHALHTVKRQLLPLQLGTHGVAHLRVTEICPLIRHILRSGLRHVKSIP